MGHSGAEPLVSVILPTFNRGYCVSRAIESVLRQTHGNLELIVVDDCSDDNTAEVLSQFNDPRMRVVRHAVNRGGAAARNTGIAHAKGSLIAFQDSDDEWCVTMLQRQLAYRAEKGPQFGLSYCAKVVHGRDDHGNVGPRYVALMPRADREVVEGDVTREILNNALVSTQTLIVSKSIIDQVGGFDETLQIGLDWEFTARIARVTLFAYVNEPLVMTYVMNDSISHRRIYGGHTIGVIMDKHRDIFEADARLRAQKLFQIARIYQRYKLYRTALKYAFGAWRSNPTHIGAAGAVLLSLVRYPFGAGPIFFGPSIDKEAKEGAIVIAPADYRMPEHLPGLG